MGTIGQVLEKRKEITVERIGLCETICPNDHTDKHNY